nr:helitron helicase-like domain-containing protein [Tanacetum cinerariifolium]
MNVCSRLRETESSSNISPTCFIKNYDAINAVAVNVGAHVCQPESLSSFEPTLSTYIFSKSVGNGTTSECNVASNNDICTESIFLQKERRSKLNRQQQEGSSTFLSANVGTSFYTHNCSPFGHSDELAADQTKRRRTTSVHASSTHRHFTIVRLSIMYT